MKIPPYTSVKLVEFADRLELLPVGWARDCVCLGRFKSKEIGFQSHEKHFHDWNRMMGDNDIYVVVN
jgi:hypothetical protein